MGYFVYIMKILCNRAAYHERPLLRNVVFDSFRCLSAAIAYPILLEGHIEIQKLVPDFMTVAIMSILVNSFVDRKWFAQTSFSRIVWSMALIEMVQFFG